MMWLALLKQWYLQVPVVEVLMWSGGTNDVNFMLANKNRFDEVIGIQFLFITLFW